MFMNVRFLLQLKKFNDVFYKKGQMHVHLYMSKGWNNKSRTSRFTLILINSF